MSDDMVLVPREVLTAAASELRAWSGHWAVGVPRLEKVVEHDRRMKDGSCCTCALLEILNDCSRGGPLPTK